MQEPGTHTHSLSLSLAGCRASAVAPVGLQRACRPAGEKRTESGALLVTSIVDEAESPNSNAFSNVQRFVDAKGKVLAYLGKVRYPFPGSSSRVSLEATNGNGSAALPLPLPPLGVCILGPDQETKEGVLLGEVTLLMSTPPPTPGVSTVHHSATPAHRQRRWRARRLIWRDPGTLRVHPPSRQAGVPRRLQPY